MGENFKPYCAHRGQVLVNTVNFVYRGGADSDDFTKVLNALTFDNTFRYMNISSIVPVETKAVEVYCWVGNTAIDKWVILYHAENGRPCTGVQVVTANRTHYFSGKVACTTDRKVWYRGVGVIADYGVQIVGWWI